MFDLGAAELLVIVVVAIVVIGPKDMPMALRTAGRWIGKVRKVSTHFRTGLDAMVREAELEDMEQKWKEQNEAIMAKSGSEMTGPPAMLDDPTVENADPVNPSSPAAAAESAAKDTAAPASKAGSNAPDNEPQLPLGSSDNPSKGEG